MTRNHRAAAQSWLAVAARSFAALAGLARGRAGRKGLVLVVGVAIAFRANQSSRTPGGG
jgi:hypothetical protein